MSVMNKVEHFQEVCMQDTNVRCGWSNHVCMHDSLNEFIQYSQMCLCFIIAIVVHGWKSKIGIFDQMSLQAPLLTVKYFGIQQSNMQVPTAK